MDTQSEPPCCDPRAAAVALGRWCIGLIFFFFGLRKFADLNGFATGMAKQFENTWLPSLLTTAFGHVLPFCEVAVGALLLLGLFRFETLFATGVLLLFLTFGQIILGNAAVVFNNTVYLFLTAGLLFLNNYDMWVIFPRKRRTEPVR